MSKHKNKVTPGADPWEIDLSGWEDIVTDWPGAVLDWPDPVITWEESLLPGENKSNEKTAKDEAK